MKKSCPLFLAVSALIALMVGCESIDTSIFGGSFGRNSSAMVGGGAVAGQDYVIGLRPSEAAQQYFASASLSSEGEPVTVSPGDDRGTGVVWTDDGGIVIPPGTTIVFTNKGCCLDPHLPAPKADEEMQFIKTSCLIPTELQGTYKNLLRRAAAGDEDVKSNLQRLIWALRTAGSNDAYAKNLTDRQREILAECAEAGSFDGYCQNLHRFDWLKKLVKEQVGQVADQLQVEVGNVTYKASDLLDPEIGKQKVSAHLGELIHMNEYLPVVQSGFNYGELQKGIYTDIKGNGSLSFKAKVANSTSEPFVFYPMDYVAQVGSGQNMQGAFFAAADSSMKQRTTEDVPEKAEASKSEKVSDDGIVSLLNKYLALYPSFGKPNKFTAKVSINPYDPRFGGWFNPTKAYYRDGDKNEIVFRNQDVINIMRFASDLDVINTQILHELAHYYQDVILSANGYYKPSEVSTERAEGFAILMAARASDGGLDPYGNDSKYVQYARQYAVDSAIKSTGASKEKWIKLADAIEKYQNCSKGLWGGFAYFFKRHYYDMAVQSALNDLQMTEIIFLVKK